MGSLQKNEFYSQGRSRKAGAGSDGKEKQKMANDGVTNIIYDLRTSLTSVRSLSKILHDNPDINGKKRREFLDIIIQQTERMTGIIKRAESPIRSMSESIT